MIDLPLSTAVQRIRPPRVGLLLTILLFGVLGPGLTFAGVEEEIRSLRRDMQEMKKDVADIKELLEGALKKAPPAKTVATVGFRGRPMLGRADAPLTIVEFSDYQCPYCQRFVTNVFPNLKRDYIDTGKVRYVFRDFPLTQIHPQAAKAHEGAHCAGEQDRYWDMHDLLFLRQKDLSLQALSTYANELGFDVDAFDACLKDDRHEAAVQVDIEAGAEAGVRGTPSFIIGMSGDGDTITGTIVRGAQPFSTFQQVIQAVQNPLPANDRNVPTAQD
jgi:protein-disulfide isomerase